MRGPQDGERGDVLLGWLTKLVAGMALVGVVGFDVVSVATGTFTAEDHAQSAARAAVESYRTDRDVQRAYDTALAQVAQHGETLDVQGFTVGADGAVTLRLRREVPTLVVEKIGPLRRQFGVVTRTVTGIPAP